MMTRHPLQPLALLATALSVVFLSACSTTGNQTRKPFAECTPASQVDTPAKIKTSSNVRIDPDWYPEGALVKVVYQFEVTPEGKMGRKIYQPEDADPRIIKAIERSFARWRFTPALRNGQPVTTCFEQPYDLIFKKQ